MYPLLKLQTKLPILFVQMVVCLSQRPILHSSISAMTMTFILNYTLVLTLERHKCHAELRGFNSFSFSEGQFIRSITWNFGTVYERQMKQSRLLTCILRRYITI